MTTKRRDGGDTPFSAWIRDQPGLDAKRDGYDLEDCDRLHARYFWHQYMQAYLMFLEEKQYNREPSFAQRDTLSVINQALWHSFRDSTFKVRRLNVSRPTEYTYFGYHLIQFEKTSPADGGIRIDHIRVTEQEVLRFLQFDRRFMEERLHFTPQTISISEQLASCPQAKPKRRGRKRDYSVIPTLFNPAPIEQQVLDWGMAL